MRLLLKYILLLIAFGSSFSLLAQDILETDKIALRAIYDAAGGDNWTNTVQNIGKWDFNTPVTTWNPTTKTGWYGVTVRSGRVFTLKLSYNNLSGFISPKIGDLKAMYMLEFTGNFNLKGSLPTTLGDLPNLLNLYIYANGIEGSLPLEFGKLTGLKHLSLQGNKLSGPIPSVIGNLKNLLWLNLSANQLSESIPASIGNLLNLTDLSLNNNLLKGEIPSSFGNLKKVHTLRLEKNFLTGRIPKEIQGMSSLMNFFVNDNLLSGKINDLSGIATLKNFTFYNNKFRFVDFKDEFLTYKTNITTNLTFSPQAKINNPETITKSTGQSVTLTMYPKDDTNYLADDTYQWFKSNVAIPGATSKEYTIPALALTHAGVYTCKSYHTTNPDMSPLVLEREPITLTVINCPTLTGTIENNPVSIATNTAINFSLNTTAAVQSYAWEFYGADSVTLLSTQTTATATQTYTIPGNYRVKLVAKDASGCPITIADKTFEVINQCPPIIGKIVNHDEDINVNYRGNFSFETAATVSSYYWQFYDLNGIIQATSTLAAPQVNNVYTAPGYYRVVLVVKDQNGCETKFDQKFRATNLSSCTNFNSNCNPQITFSNRYGDTSGILINELTTASVSCSDPNTVIEWTLFDKDNKNIKTGEGPSFSFIVTNFEKYRLRVRTADTGGCSQSSLDLIVRDKNNCVITPLERGNSSIQTTGFRGAGANVPTELFLYSATNFSTQGFEFKWNVYDLNGVLMKTGNLATLPITFPAVGNYKVDLVIKDPVGCVTSYTKTLAVIGTCEFTTNDRYARIVSPNESSSSTIFTTNVNENKELSIRFNAGDVSNQYTYNWSLQDPNETIIKTGTLSSFSFVSTMSGFYKITVEVINKSTGCKETYTKLINSLINNSCTATNTKSPIVKDLFFKLIKKLVTDAINGQTDAQISGTTPQELINLKPYITTGGDKIYNFKTVMLDGGLRSLQFSFAAASEFDIRINFDYLNKDDLPFLSLFLDRLIDISQYVTYNDYLITCLVRSGEAMKISKIEPGLEDCYKRSDIRFVNFCPSESCTPVVGQIVIGDGGTVEVNSFYFQGIWDTNDTIHVPEKNSWVDYIDATGLQKRFIIGAMENGCQTITAKRIVATNGVESCETAPVGECMQYEILGGTEGRRVSFINCEGISQLIIVPAGDSLPICSRTRIGGAILLEFPCDSINPVQESVEKSQLPTPKQNNKNILKK